MYKFVVYSPRDEKVIEAIISVAAEAGAGLIGNYTHCAFVSEGYGVWKPMSGANPTIGKIGELSREEEVKIEMECPKDKLRVVFEAVRKVHPYEKIAIDAVEFERFE